MMPRQINKAIPPISVVAQITRLPQLPMPEIKSLWQRLFDGAAPTHNRQFLERRIAYRLQEIEFRKVDPNLLERNKRRIASLVETGMLKKRDRDYRPVAGTMLTREYRDKEYRVIVSADGQYELEGRTYAAVQHDTRPECPAGSARRTATGRDESPLIDCGEARFGSKTAYQCRKLIA